MGSGVHSPPLEHATERLGLHLSVLHSTIEVWTFFFWFRLQFDRGRYRGKFRYFPCSSRLIDQLIDTSICWGQVPTGAGTNQSINQDERIEMLLKEDGSMGEGVVPIDDHHQFQDPALTIAWSEAFDSKANKPKRVSS